MTAPSAPMMITVLGHVRCHWRLSRAHESTTEITGFFGPRQRELLAFLAVHRDGTTRDALTGALWPDSPRSSNRPTNALNAVLGRLRRAVAAATDDALTDILIVGNGRYRLDPTLVDVDLWRFYHAVTAQREAATDAARIDAYRQVIGAYTGKLADDMTSGWLDIEHVAIRRKALDAVAALARALIDTDPTQALELLETAKDRDPHNELIYRDIMRLQSKLGRHHAIPHTLTLLTQRLAEINDQPSRHALELAAQLQGHHDRPTRQPGHQPTRPVR